MRLEGSLSKFAVKLELAAKIVAAYVSNNSVPATDLSALISSVHDILETFDGTPVPAAAGKAPAVPVRKSITPDFIICLEDGKKLKMLKRYLRTRFKLTPDEYRTKWGLPADYPMVAPSYSVRRSDYAKKFGLGRTPRSGRRKRKG